MKCKVVMERMEGREGREGRREEVIHFRLDD